MSGVAARALPASEENEFVLGRFVSRPLRNATPVAHDQNSVGNRE